MEIRDIDLRCCFAVAFLGVAASACESTAQRAPGDVAGNEATAVREPLENANQHLVVIVDEPSATSGFLQRFERSDSRGEMRDAQRETTRDPAGETRWRPVGDPIPVVVGGAGVGPKEEGDGRSPRGVFSLGSAFGYSETPPAGLAIPYRPMGPGTVCVDDARSPYYNRIVESAGRDGEWDSAEAMRRDLAYGDGLYELGVVVDYNPDRTPGAGSCIFLHVWRNPESPTAGCTAMSEGDLREVLDWLRPDARPILIQGSRRYLEDLRREGLLPYAVPR